MLKAGRATSLFHHFILLNHKLKPIKIIAKHRLFQADQRLKNTFPEPYFNLYINKKIAYVFCLALTFLFLFYCAYMISITKTNQLISLFSDI